MKSSERTPLLLVKPENHKKFHLVLIIYRLIPNLKSLRGYSNEKNISSSTFFQSFQFQIFKYELVGPENDLAESQLKNVGFKSVHQTDNVNRVTISRLTRGTEETEFTDEKSTDKSPGNEDETEFMKTIVDDLVANKSIRRPLRNMKYYFLSKTFFVIKLIRINFFHV